jgi:hypothetical protein
MIKRILGLVFFMSIFNFVWASELKIISREEWWADESFTDLNSSYWQTIIAERKRFAEETGTVQQESSYARNQEKNKKRVAYLNANFAERYAISWKLTFNWDTKLAWPVSYSKKIDAILVHHTYSEYESSEAGIKNIYKYHALSNQWWDIWYNYIIWYNWEIYEWRLWWDYAMSSHSVWNNYSTVSISLMWNYEKRKMTPIQYNSLKNLIEDIVYKYDIDLSRKIPLHHTCSNCDDWLKTEYFSPIASHKDWWHTACPWEYVYNELESLNNLYLQDQIKYKKAMVKLWKILSQSSTESLEDLNIRLKVLTQKKYSSKQIYLLKEISKKLSTELGIRAL